jgi:hypothetical protein
MQALAHAQLLSTSHIHALVCSVPSTQMNFPPPKFPANMQQQMTPAQQQTPPSPSDSSGSARSTPSNMTVSTLNEEQRPKASRKRKSQNDDASTERKLAKEMPPHFIRDRVVSAASLTEAMMKREKLEQALRDKSSNQDEEAESSAGGIQKQQAKCAVCEDLAFGKFCSQCSKKISIPMKIP